MQHDPDSAATGRRRSLMSRLTDDYAATRLAAGFLAIGLTLSLVFHEARPTMGMSVIALATLLGEIFREANRRESRTAQPNSDA